MNKKNIGLFIFTSTIIIGGNVIQNIFNHHAIFSNVPWFLILMGAGAYLFAIKDISYKFYIPITFIISLIICRIFGGYYDSSSWFVFILVSCFYSFLTYLLVKAFKKDQ